MLTRELVYGAALMCVLVFALHHRADTGQVTRAVQPSMK